jgi:cell division protein FtsW
MVKPATSDPLFTYGISREISRTKAPIHAYEPILITLSVILICFSLIMVYSTTGVVALEKFGDSYFYVKRQAISACIGFALMFIASRINIQWLKKISPYFFYICLGLLLATYLPGIGDRAGGAQRWLNLGIVRFQPGEFVKVLFIIFIASLIAKSEGRLSEFFTGIIKPFLFVGAICALFLKQPDFGSSAIISIVTLGLIAASGARIRYLALLFCGLVVTAAALVVMSPYRMKRVTSFLQPWADPAGSGYQLIQSLIALGSGDIGGVGLGSSQQKLFFLPAAHTDFIFAVIGEELGMIGCLILMSVFFLFFVRGIILAGRVAEDTFSFCLILGMTLLIVVPAMLNAGVVTGVLPTKGMVLPLVGYGGSSIISCLGGIGLILAVVRDQVKENQLKK